MFHLSNKLNYLSIHILDVITSFAIHATSKLGGNFNSPALKFQALIDKHVLNDD